MRLILLLSLLLILAGCVGQLPPNHAEFYKALGTTCTPTVLELPAPGGGIYRMPMQNHDQSEACRQGMTTVYEMNRSGWERFGTAAVNMIGNVGVTAAPWFAAGYIAQQGFRAAGDEISGSYNHAEANQANPVSLALDNSQRNPVSTSSTNNSVNGSNNPDNSDNRTNYGNPVTYPTTVVPSPAEVLP